METDEKTINSPLIHGGSSKGDEWGTIFVVYALVSLQLLLAISFGTNVVFSSGIPRFDQLHTTPGLITCIISFILWLVGNGITILETIILMSVVTVSLTTYALCGTIGDSDFNLCQPCFLSIFLVVCLYVSIQIFHDNSENLWTSIYGFLVALLFCGHTYIAGNQIVKDYDSDIEGPISAVIYSYWTFLYYIYLKLATPRR
ncbi:hypothetical protein REPUB_Repub11eG0068400 [Reevesia pubescens]